MQREEIPGPRISEHGLKAKHLTYKQQLIELVYALSLY